MANTKTYTVVKDGEELKELKTLPAAKKLADTEEAEVWCEGKCVYQGTIADSEDTVKVLSEADIPVKETSTLEKYTLTAKMNIRKAPDKDAPKLGIAQTGTVVEVAAIKNDWLHLTDGTFILYEGGRFARKN